MYGLDGVQDNMSKYSPPTCRIQLGHYDGVAANRPRSNTKLEKTDVETEVDEVLGTPIDLLGTTSRSSERACEFALKTWPIQLPKLCFAIREANCATQVDYGRRSGSFPAERYLFFAAVNSVHGYEPSDKPPPLHSPILSRTSKSTAFASSQHYVLGDAGPLAATLATSVVGSASNFALIAPCNIFQTFPLAGSVSTMSL
jgi:hypothetical protein